MLQCDLREPGNQSPKVVEQASPHHDTTIHCPPCHALLVPPAPSNQNGPQATFSLPAVVKSLPARHHLSRTPCYVHLFRLSRWPLSSARLAPDVRSASHRGPHTHLSYLHSPWLSHSVTRLLTRRLNYTRTHGCMAFGVCAQRFLYRRQIVPDSQRLVLPLTNLAIVQNLPHWKYSSVAVLNTSVPFASFFAPLWHGMVDVSDMPTLRQAPTCGPKSFTKWSA